MEHRKVREVMNDAVVRVQRGTSFKEVAHVLREYDITAVPVVDADDRPLGVVSEADLLHKMAEQAGWGDLHSVAVPDDKAWAVDAEGLMTSPALCAEADWSVVEAARAMEQHHVKRLLVVDEDGRLTGVVSRSDLLQVYLRKDQAIRTEIVEDVVVKALGEAPSALSVEVTNGHVVLSGRVSDQSLVPVLERLCRSVDGVVAVDSRLVRGDGPAEDHTG